MSTVQEQQQAAQAYLDAQLIGLDEGVNAAPIINAAIGMLPDPVVGIDLEMLPPLRIPWGRYTLEPTQDGVCVDFSKACRLYCGGSTFDVPTDQVGGFDVIAFNIGPDASLWSQIESAIILGDSPSTDTETVGIHVESHGVTVRDIVCKHVGTAVRVFGADPTNANGVRIDNVYAFLVAQAGLHIKGGDTNGGTITGLRVNGSERYGVLDESFLGNVFVGLHLHSTKLEAYKATAPANYSAHLGTYIEGDCGSELPGGTAECVVGQSAMSFFGGGAVNYVRRGHGDRIGRRAARIEFSESMPDGGTMRVAIPFGGINAGLAVTRERPGQPVERVDIARWQDLFKQCGIVVDSSGLVRPYGWTSQGHAEGIGVPKVDAQNATGETAGRDIPEDP